MNTNNRTATPSVASRIAGLPELPLAEIKGLWLKLFGSDIPVHNRKFLERRIAYQLQLNEFRKVDANAKLIERNQKRIAALIETGQVKKRDRDYRPAVGTSLTREYQGTTYHVKVTADAQYDFQGRIYPSLSMIAREITGTRWSGPLFFGLKALAVPKVAKKGARR